MRTFFSRNTIFFYLVSLICIFVLFPYLIPFIIGISIAYIYEPFLEKIVKYFNLNKQIWKWIISIILIFITLTAVIGPIFTLITTGIQESVSLLNALDNELKNPTFINNASKSLSMFLSQFSLHFSAEEIIIKGTEILKNFLTYFASGAGVALSATPGFIIKTIVILLTWIFFMVHGKNYREQFLPKIIPWHEERIIISKTIASVLKALIVANILVSTIQAILITATLAIFGIPRFALLGIIAFFASFIPVIGTAPIMIGAAAWCYFNEGKLSLAIGILVCAILVSLIDNILRPYLMKGSADLSFFWIFLAIVGGMSQFGIIGAVLGPVCFALFVAAIKTLNSETQYLNIDLEKQEAPNP